MEADRTRWEALDAGVFLGLQAWCKLTVMYPSHTPLPQPPVRGIPPSRLRDMVYRLLEERSKKGAGRSMRALAWRVCAWVLPLYRNLEPITRKPLGGGSGDTSLQGRGGGKEEGPDLQCQPQGWTTAGPPSCCLTSYDNSCSIAQSCLTL